MAADNTPVTMREKLGIGMFVVFGPILAGTYWERNIAPLSALPPIVVALVSALLCAIGLAIVAKNPKKRSIALLTGALAGFGGTFLFNFIYSDTDRIGRERYLVLIAGMAPGLLLGWFLAHRLDKQEAAAKT